jgi:hypothetical protein
LHESLIHYVAAIEWRGRQASMRAFCGCVMSAMASPGREFEPKQIVGTQLRKTLNAIPAYTWYAVPSGTLTFVNEAYADYLGLAKDDPLRLGLETGVAWDTHIELVHPHDREETLRVGANCVDNQRNLWRALTQFPQSARVAWPLAGSDGSGPGHKRFAM